MVLQVALRGQKSFLVPHICWLDASSDLRPWADQLCGAPYDWVTSIEVALGWSALHLH